MRLRTVSLFATFFILIGLAYTAFWNAAAHRLQGWIDGWIEARRAEGARIETAGVAITGFPLRLIADIRDLQLRLADGATAKAPQLTAAALPWAPLQIRLDLPAGGHLTLPDTDARPGIDVTAGPGDGAVVLAQDGRVQQAALTLEDVAAGLAGGALQTRLGHLSVDSRWPDLPAGDHRAVGLRTTVAAEAITLPVPPPGLPAVVDGLSITARVQGAPPSPLTADTLTRWSNDGGTLEIERLELRWGSLGAVATGTLALDGQLQPMGAASATVRGLDSLVQALAGAGRIKPNQGAIARAALGLLSKPAADGVPELTAPLTLQDRRLTLGPLPLATIPEIRWP
jgi:hypothetical protein